MASSCIGRSHAPWYHLHLQAVRPARSLPGNGGDPFQPTQNTIFRSAGLLTGDVRPPCLRRLTPAAFSLGLHKGTTRLVIAILIFLMIKVIITSLTAFVNEEKFLFQKFRYSPKEWGENAKNLDKKATAVLPASTAPPHQGQEICSSQQIVVDWIGLRW